MTGFKLGRLQLGPPSIQVTEPVGDPVAGVGGAVVTAPRVPQQIQVQLNTVYTGATTVAQAQTLRRQLRSLLNNSPLKFQGFLYAVYDDDTELNGWYVPDASTLASRDSTSFKAGLWETSTMNMSLAGHLRTHRPGRQVWMKDLTTGDYQRDTLGAIYSTEFAAYAQGINGWPGYWASVGQPASAALVVLPPGASGIVQGVVNQVYPSSLLPPARDGSQGVQLAGVSDLIALVYDYSEAALNQSDVVVYDRRGQITAPVTGPDTNWEEVYGPDYPWNWLTVGQAVDCPVLDNGLCRVRYDSSNTPGFRVDVWTGTQYTEQGKMIVVRRAGTVNSTDTVWVSAALREYTPDRAVVQVVMQAPGDAYSRETIFITLSRGQIGAVFEVYPAVQGSGTQCDCQLVWTPAGGADLNDSIFKSDDNTAPTGPGTGFIAATAGSGSALFGASTAIGAGSFLGENLLAFLRFIGGIATVGPYQHQFAVVQGANCQARADSNSFGTSAYGGAAANDLIVRSQNNAGYLQNQVSFCPATSDQASEAETIRNASGTTSQVADVNASGGQTVQETQTATTNPTLRKVTTNLLQAKYRIMVRVRGGTAGAANLQAALGATAGAMVIAPLTTSYQWIDLGDVLSPSANPQLTIMGSIPATSFLTSPTGVGVAKWPVYPWGLLSTNFWYAVTARNAAGETPAFVGRGTNSFGEVQTSPHPTNGGKQLMITWNAVPGATSYNVYRGAVAAGATQVAPALIANVSVGTLQFLDSGVNPTSGPPGSGAAPTTNTASISGASPLFIDRYEAFLVEDRARSGQIYIGARDQSLSALYDSRTLGLLSSR